LTRRHWRALIDFLNSDSSGLLCPFVPLFRSF